MATHFPRSQVARAATQNRPDTTDTENAPFNSALLVHRLELDLWDDLYRLQCIGKEDFCTMLPFTLGLTK